MSEAHEKVEALFEAAVALETEEQRADYLSRACPDPELRREVESLLACHENPDGIFSERTVRMEPAAFEGVGATLGRYKLLEHVGEGGCGVVYVAEQTEPVRRRVALKVIKLGMDTKAVVARFEAERQALAMMDHPNIAKVLDAGTTGAGRPYFVMELVRGIRITDYCDQANLSTKERLDLFIKVCQAIQHAHQKGIIHRDIKPSNILVTLHDGVPVPKVIDFGIAKATEGRLTNATVYTQLHQFIGTPAYMSPEQAEMSGLGIDTRSDIYSLGVLLYELLVGKPPFEGNELVSMGLDAMRKTIREKEPARPSTRLATLRGEELTTTAKRRSVETSKLANLLRADLDWIVMRCLEKDRARRYDTANGLAADIRRHLDNEPITARPPSTVYRFQKALRRNKLAFTATAVVALALAVGITVSTWQAIRATRARRAESEQRIVADIAKAQAQAKQQEAEAQRQRADIQAQNAVESEEHSRRLLYAADMNLAQHSLQQNNLGTALDLLERHRPAPGGRDLRGWEWRYLWQGCQSDELRRLGSHADFVTGVRFFPTRPLLASASHDHTVKVWELATGKVVASLDHDGYAVRAIDISPDGRWLATGRPGRLSLWDAHTWEGATSWPMEGGVASVTFSPDGKQLATAQYNRVVLWDVATHHVISGFPGIAAGLGSQELCFSPDGRMLAYQESEGFRVGLWDIRLRTNTVSLAGHKALITSLAFSPQGKLLAAGSWDKTIKVWNLEDPGGVVTLTNHTAWVAALAFSPRGDLLATASADQTIKLWNTTNWNQIASLKGHSHEIWALAYSPDGLTLASGGKDDSVRLWETTTRPDQTTMRYPPAEAARAIPSPTWEQFALLYGDGTLGLWNTTVSAESPRVAASFPRVESGAWALSPGGALLARGTQDGTVQLWAPDSGPSVTELSLGGKNGGQLSFSADGKRLAVVSEDHRWIQLWDVMTMQKTLTLTNEFGSMFGAPVFSPDRRELGTRHWSEFRVWNLEERRSRALPQVHRSPLFAIAFSPDGRSIATTGNEGTMKLWDRTTLQELTTLRGQLLSLHSIAFSPDGRRVAAGTADEVKIWDTETYQEVATLRGHSAPGVVLGLSFLEDGNTLISVVQELFSQSLPFPSEIGVWRAPSFAEIVEKEAQNAPEP